MPLIPETIFAMLAVARIGAVHSVVFGGKPFDFVLITIRMYSRIYYCITGFAACELCTRIQHAEPKVIIAANCGIEPNKIVK